MSLEINPYSTPAFRGDATAPAPQQGSGSGGAAITTGLVAGGVTTLGMKYLLKGKEMDQDTFTKNINDIKFKEDLTDGEKVQYEAAKKAAETPATEAPKEGEAVKDAPKTETPVASSTLTERQTNYDNAKTEYARANEKLELQKTLSGKAQNYLDDATVYDPRADKKELAEGEKKEILANQRKDLQRRVIADKKKLNDPDLSGRAKETIQQRINGNQQKIDEISPKIDSNTKLTENYMTKLQEQILNDGAKSEKALAEANTAKTEAEKAKTEAETKQKEAKSKLDEAKRSADKEKIAEMQQKFDEADKGLVEAEGKLSQATHDANLREIEHNANKEIYEAFNKPANERQTALKQAKQRLFKEANPEGTEGKAVENVAKKESAAGKALDRLEDYKEKAATYEKRSAILNKDLGKETKTLTEAPKGESTKVLSEAFEALKGKLPKTSTSWTKAGLWGAGVAVAVGAIVAMMGGSKSEQA